MNWSGKKAVVCTMHGKENVIHPALEPLGMQWVSGEFNTDQFGTFTGEVERFDSPIVTARKKCQLAFEQSDATIVIASEGSFGPHPSIPFLAINEEVLLFCDRETNLEISVHSISPETNFSQCLCSSFDEVKAFSERIGFPEHGLILRDQDAHIIHKGIVDSTELRSRFDQLLSSFGRVVVETDMRALYNPTRMKHIGQTAERLCAKLLSYCPNCNHPGFGEERYESGLPCAQCGLPTSSTRSKEVYCIKCTHKLVIKYPNGKETEDPQFCSFCNP